MHCRVSYYSILQYIVLLNTSADYNILCKTLQFSKLHCSTVVFYTTKCHITVYYIVVHYTTAKYIDYSILLVYNTLLHHNITKCCIVQHNTDCATVCNLPPVSQDDDTI